MRTRGVEDLANEARAAGFPPTSTSPLSLLSPLPLRPRLPGTPSAPPTLISRTHVWRRAWACCQWRLLFKWRAGTCRCSSPMPLSSVLPEVPPTTVCRTLGLRHARDHCHQLPLWLGKSYPLPTLTNLHPALHRPWLPLFWVCPPKASFLLRVFALPYRPDSPVHYGALGTYQVFLYFVALMASTSISHFVGIGAPVFTLYVRPFTFTNVSPMVLSSPCGGRVCGVSLNFVSTASRLAPLVASPTMIHRCHRRLCPRLPCPT